MTTTKRKPRKHGDAACLLIDELADALAAKDAEIAELRAQLPDEMKHCTILFKECELGHGRLTATNWIDHGCQWCKVRALEQQVAGVREFLDDGFVVSNDRQTALVNMGRIDALKAALSTPALPGDILAFLDDALSADALAAKEATLRKHMAVSEKLRVALEMIKMMEPRAQSYGGDVRRCAERALAALEEETE